MVKISSFFLILLLNSAISAQTSDTLFNQTDHLNRKQGYWKKQYKNGAIAYKGFFKDDKPQGEMIRNYDTGKIRTKLNFTSNGDSASVIFYYSNSREAAKGKFFKTKKDGKWEYLGQAGNVVFTEFYENGEKNGLFTTYYPTGEIYEVIKWANGVKDGGSITYFQNGLIMSSVSYKNGKEHGPVISYYYTGKKRIEGFYNNGFKDGVWKVYTPDEKVMNEIKYINGRAENQDKLIEEETLELEKQLQNAGRIEEPGLDEFARQMGM